MGRAGGPLVGPGRGLDDGVPAAGHRPATLCSGARAAALSLGLLVGVAGVADALIARMSRLRAIYAAVGVYGCAVGAIGLCDWAPGLLLCALIGLSMSVTQLVGQTHRLLAMPQDFRAHMTAGHIAVAQLAGVLMLHLPVGQVYLLLAVGFLLSGTLVLAVPQLPRFLSLDHAEVKN